MNACGFNVLVGVDHPGGVKYINRVPGLRGIWNKWALDTPSLQLLWHSVPVIESTTD